LSCWLQPQIAFHNIIKPTIGPKNPTFISCLQKK
jgi:hypothetical protein